MAKVKVIIQPTGLLNGKAWPAPGGTLDVPDVVAESMAAVGHVEIVKAAAPKVEKRPAKVDNVETRKAAPKKV